MFARVVCAAFSVWRLTCSSVLLTVPNEAAVALGLIEATMALLSLYNAFAAKEVDASIRGLLPPMIYTAGYYVRPEGDLTPQIECVLWGIVAFRLAAVLALRESVTCGLTTFAGLKTRGVYRLVRHPMQLSGICSRLVFFAAWPTGVNGFGLAMMTFGSVLIVLSEEEFLSRFEGWKEYTERTPDRLIPGIW